MRTILRLSLIFLPFLALAQLQSPSEFLGYELGTEFTRHHQVVEYYKYLAANRTGPYDLNGIWENQREKTIDPSDYLHQEQYGQPGNYTVRTSEKHRW